LKSTAMSSEKPPNPIADLAEGATKGGLEYTDEKLGSLLTRFRNRELAFVEDPETINLAKEQRKTSEWSLFKEYVDDPDLRIQFLLGLTLRRLERQPDGQNPLNALRRKIVDKYGIEGLHVAQLIQNGFFNKFLANALERSSTPQQLKLEIQNFLKNIEKTVIFVKEADNARNVVAQIQTKLLAFSPSTFIICSYGSSKETYRAVKDTIRYLERTKAIDYEYEHYEGLNKRALFLNRKIEE
jgi:hypothetical protein